MICEKELKEALNFYGTPTIVKRDGKKVHTVEEAIDWCYNWVEVLEVEPEGDFLVLTHTSEPHLWPYGGEVSEFVPARGLNAALCRAFERVRWSFPTRPKNIQEWSDV
jgi:hypothetical protein